MKALLLKLMTVLGVGGYPIVNEFNPPLGMEDNSVNEYFYTRFDWVPTDLEEMYKWHNGQAYPQPVKNLDFLFDNALFLPFQQAGLHFDALVEVDSIFKDYFPVFTSGGGEYYLIKVLGEEKGSIYYYSPNKFLGEPVKAFNSLQALLNSILACYNAGIYRNEGGRFNKDIRMQMKIMSELNIGCQRWLDTGPL